MRILLVDDDPDIRLLAGLELRKDGHDVAEAADGEEAVYRAANERPDVIVLDLMMPRRDGYSVLEELQVIPETEDIPVIILSARAGNDDRRRGIDAGAEEFIVKPYAPDDLRAAVLRATGPDEYEQRWLITEELSALSNELGGAPADPWGSKPR